MFQFSANQFKAFPMEVQNFDGGVFFEVFSEFSNVHIHTAGVEISIISPNEFQGETPAHGFIFILRKKL
jgi:hypothetical protein